MTTYERCKNIRRVILNTAAEVIAYNWSNEFNTKQMKELVGQLGKADPEYLKIQPSLLTVGQMCELGFGKFSSNDIAMLIPLWLYPYLAKDVMAGSIGGEAVYKKSSMDTDNRCGWLAYGVMPAEEEEQ